MYTAQGIIMASSEFRKIAATEALELIAKTNGQTYELTLQAYRQGVPNVVNKVADLVHEAAQALADKLNTEAA